ncbi:MAG: serine/threonine-protein kinase [Planctomycetota bacterium]
MPQTPDELPTLSPSGFGGAVPDAIGPYRLIRELGQGGFGVVFEAEQIQPVKRRVALKLLKAGMDSAAVVARFEAERQALAVMNHPAIAKVFDGGVTTPEYGSRPFFVMEFVEGEPITTYCDRVRLSIRDRLELLRRVCEGVHHAHAKGVVHRDLKPANVLVTEVDGTPEPRVIDFGIAKALDDPLTVGAARTLEGQVIGTPEYMSPEQAGLSPDDIDTRADVYALGILMHELLVGVLPFEPSSLRDLGLQDLRRVIANLEAKPPSTRLDERRSKSPERAREIAEQRATDLPALRRELRRDLDWVVLRCLERERERRYPSAAALALELERYLARVPVEAGPPSLSRRTSTFARRYKGPLVAAGLVFAALVAGLVGTVAGLVEANTQRELAERQAAEAERQLGRATELSSFLGGMLGSITPDNAQGMDTELLQGVLDRALVDLDSDRINNEDVQHELRLRIGNVYEAIGQPGTAVHVIRPALDALAERDGWSSDRTQQAATYLARALQAQGEIDEAEILLRRIIEHAPGQPSGDDPASTAINNLATVMLEREDYELAEPILTRLYDIRVRALGENDPATLTALHNLGVVAAGNGDLPLAIERYELALEGRRETLGETHPQVLATINNLGRALDRSGEQDRAAEMLGESYELHKQIMGESHPSALMSGANYASSLYMVRRLDEMNEVLDAVIEAAPASIPEGHWVYSSFYLQKARALLAMDRFEEAAEFAGAAHDTIAGTPFETPDRMRGILNILTRTYERWHEAEPDAGHDAAAAEWRAKLELVSSGG